MSLLSSSDSLYPMIIRTLSMICLALSLSACAVITPVHGPDGEMLAWEIAVQTAIANPGQCRDELALPAAPRPGQTTLDGAAIDLLSWNIRKGSLPDWRRDLARLSLDKELVLIQEATAAMPQQSRVLPAHWAFAPGYADFSTQSGVATASHVAPLLRCRFQTTEPWLRTPKATKITRYALAGSGRTLAVANIHMVNFALGLADFRAQLEALVLALSAHDGPLIVSGDFNTWSGARSRLMHAAMARLDAKAVAFADDRRTRIFGAAVDHVFVAGLHVESATAHVVESSDHNPLSLRLVVL